MQDLDQIPTNYEDACALLARWHAEDMEQPIRVMCFPDPCKEEVRLIEVSDGFPSNLYGAVMGSCSNGGPGKPKVTIPVVTLRGGDEFPFRSSVALVTEDEWGRITSGDLAVAGNWEMDTHYQIWPE